MQAIDYRRVGFSKFNILSLNECIGCYENDKNLNFINDGKNNKKKVFRKYKIELVLAPKNRIKLIIPKANYDIGYVLKKLDNNINYTPFIKDCEVYYSIEDTHNFIVKDLYVYLDNYYEWKEGYKIISDSLKEKDNKIKLYVKYDSEFLNNFKRTKEINYSSEVEIYDKD